MEHVVRSTSWRACFGAETRPYGTGSRVAHIEVTQEELTAGAFPPVCAKTGKTTQAVVDLRVVIMPRWSRLLLLLGVLPWFIARPVIGQGFIARIPLTEDLVARVTKSRADLTAAMLGGVFATIIGSFVPRDDLQVAFVGLGFLIVVGSVTALILGERDYGIDIRPTTWETVMLRRIHPRFRDALVRGDLTINEPSVGAIVADAQASAQAADPWG